MLGTADLGLEILIISDGSGDQRDCPNATFVRPRRQTRDALRQCYRHGGRGKPSGRWDLTFHKWDVLGWWRYEYVIFVDADADILADEFNDPPAIAAHIAKMLPPIATKPAGGTPASTTAGDAPAGGIPAGGTPWWRFAGSADASSPINAGVGEIMSAV